MRVIYLCCPKLMSKQMLRALISLCFLNFGILTTTPGRNPYKKLWTFPQYSFIVWADSMGKVESGKGTAESRPGGVWPASGAR